MPAVSRFFLLIPGGVPLSRVDAVSLADLARLSADSRHAHRKEQPWHAVARRISEGERLYWGFGELMDALACARSGTDPRLPARTASGEALEVVRVEGEPLVADDRFVRPGAGSMAAEVPGLLATRERRWLSHAVYSSPQWVFAPAGADVERAASAVRLSQGRIVERVLGDALRAARGPGERRRLQRLLSDPGRLTPEDLDACPTSTATAEALFTA
jgi:hypothetical protein